MSRIAIVTDAWHPQMNGVVITPRQTAKHLKLLGHPVKVIHLQIFRSVPCPTYQEIRLALTTRERIQKELREFSPHAVHIATEGPLGWTMHSVCKRNDFTPTISYHTRFTEVHFAGYRKGEDLTRYFAVASVFVFLSLTDTFGVVLLEVMSCGVPVAAYPVTGSINVVQNGIDGWLDPYLGIAVTKALEVSPESCRNTALKYSWQSCSNQFLHNFEIMTEPLPQSRNCATVSDSTYIDECSIALNKGDNGRTIFLPGFGP